MFANHNGYVFHDSCGFEAGHHGELHIVRDFIRKRATTSRLENRLHAIWFVVSFLRTCPVMSFLHRYCIPMENDRPALDMRFFDSICSDKNGMLTVIQVCHSGYIYDVKFQ